MQTKEIFEGKYIIYSDGRVWSRWTKKIIIPSIGKNGYYMTSKSKYIHRLVAEAFIPNPNNLRCVNHKDHNKLNNDVDNLEWCTYRHNNIHRYKSKYPGTSYDKVNKKYRVTIFHNKKTIHLGRFNTVEEAFYVSQKYRETNNLF